MECQCSVSNRQKNNTNVKRNTTASCNISSNTLDYKPATATGTTTTTSTIATPSTAATATTIASIVVIAITLSISYHNYHYDDSF